MKLHPTQNNVVKSGNFEESNFTIEASAKAFFILSDGLYSNKIKAVIRELSTNAYDSQVDAGNQDTPFDVHLPTRLEPTFYVRDYGTGMSHEDCMQLYTTYFRSTRNDSNDAVGCLGLGSKAPFAYADQFNVESYQDGVVRIYTAYQSKDGTPMFSLMDTQDTEEPNGLKVTMAVKEDDLYDFKDEATSLYQHFDVKPNVIGEELSYTDEDVQIQGKDWRIVGDKYNTVPKVIMGQIAYPFTLEDVYSIERYSDLTEEQKFLSNVKGLQVFMNIGDVDITPSREQLSFNSHTVDALKARVSEIKTAMVDEVQERIDECETLFDARVLFANVRKQFSIGAMDDAFDGMTWNGEEIFDWFGRGIWLQDETTDGTKRKVKAGIHRYEKTSWKSTPEVSRDIEKFMFEGNFKFVIDDTKRGGIGRLKEYISQKHSDRDKCTYYLIKGTDEEVSQVKEFLGGAKDEQFLYTSTMPKPFRDTRARSYSSGGGSKAMVFNHETCQFVDTSVSVKEEDAYYFTESRGDVDYNGRTHDLRQFKNILCGISSAGYDISGMKIYLVKPSVAKSGKFDTRDNWTEGTSIIVSILTQLLEENMELIKSAKNGVIVTSEYKSERVEQILEALELDCEIKELYLAYKEERAEILTYKESMDDLYYSCQRTRLDVPEVGAYYDKSLKDKTYSDRIDELFQEKYSLLIGMIDSYGEIEEHMLKEAVNYMTMKETCGE